MAWAVWGGWQWKRMLSRGVAAVMIYGNGGGGSRHFAYRSTRDRAGYYAMVIVAGIAVIHRLRAKNGGEKLAPAANFDLINRATNRRSRRRPRTRNLFHHRKFLHEPNGDYNVFATPLDRNVSPSKERPPSSMARAFSLYAYLVRGDARTTS